MEEFVNAVGLVASCLLNVWIPLTSFCQVILLLPFVEPFTHDKDEFDTPSKLAVIHEVSRV